MDFCQNGSLLFGCKSDWQIIKHGTFIEQLGLEMYSDYYS